MPKKHFIDDEERDIIDAYERGEYAISPQSNQLQNMLEKAASNYLKKDARINIRISDADLNGLKIKAAEEGMPYQTLIASVLHKFVSGRLG